MASTKVEQIILKAYLAILPFSKKDRNFDFMQRSTHHYQTQNKRENRDENWASSWNASQNHTWSKGTDNKLKKRSLDR